MERLCHHGGHGPRGPILQVAAATVVELPVVEALVIKLVDGPAEGAYAVKRAPLYLRATVDAGTGTRDVLDQLDDSPSESEGIVVYKLEGEAGTVHLSFGGTVLRTGFYVTGNYHHVADVPVRELRDTGAWRRWCAAQVPDDVNLETGRMT